MTKITCGKCGCKFEADNLKPLDNVYCPKCGVMLTIGSVKIYGEE